MGAEDNGTVLVVDDEYALRRVLVSYLAKEGYKVLEAQDGQDALNVLGKHQVDLALVDVMMPGMDGFALVRELRKRTDIPVIMLTAKGEETAKVAGLEIGADDYMTKPFSAPEVVARVRAQLRRYRGGFSSEESEPEIKVGERLVIDPSARRCFVDGEEVDLSRREFDLLHKLASSPGRVFTREALLLAAWGTTYITEKTIDVHVGSLRKKLNGSASITSLRGIGYRLDP
ncbi:MAG: response regulator transcription factor [Actinomycetota bacterium]|nr:response regulator transcription factor [Actinomycetota bacterium]